MNNNESDKSENMYLLYLTYNKNCENKFKNSGKSPNR